jgi:hypothetical protein
MTDFDDNKIDDATPVVTTSTKSEFKKNFCKYCGKELQPDAAFCSSCGKPQNNVSQQPAAQIMQQPVVRQPYVVNAYQQPQPVVAPNVSTNTTTVVVESGHSNSMGTAGFIIALLGLVFCWIPVVDLILWFLGLVFSFIGLFKAPRGLAIAGLVLSFVLIIVIIIIWSSIVSALDSIFK